MSGTRPVKPIRYGFDVGGTKIELALFDGELNCFHRERVSTPTDDYDQFVSTLINLVNKADQISGEKGSVGIGIPGIVNPKTRQQLSVNVPCLTGRNLVDDLAEKLARPVAIENDCRCFALSESKAEQTKPYSTIFGTILGTGAGGGLVVNGKLFSGSNGLAGEWGHVPMSANLIQRYQLPLFKCNCGLTACNERYVSGTGLSDLLKHSQFPTHHVPDFVNALEQKDPKAVTLFDMYLDLLASALASLQLLFDVDAFVLGGGLSNIQQIYQGLPSKMQQWLLPGLQPAAILPPIYGDSSGVRGAALLNG